MKSQNINQWNWMFRRNSGENQVASLVSFASSTFLALAILLQSDRPDTYGVEVLLRGHLWHWPLVNSGDLTCLINMR